MISGQALAQANNKAPSFTDIDALPFGVLRSKLENLPPAAQDRARAWLKSFDFPAADIAYLRADNQGGIFYEDAAMDATNIESDAAGSVDFAMTEANVFSLHSKPGATRTVYLDMDGHFVTNSVWNNRSDTGNKPSFDMQAFDTDGDSTTFNSSELNAIADTWQRVAEDFAAFDIDVTTEQPAAFGPNVGHILVSRRTDKNGNIIYPNAVGGVAYVGVWGRSNFDYYQPALVFPEGTAHRAQYMAEAAAHELGHNLGLS
ncbi:MAG: zinc-dependent metalloprotease family protein, partial [Methyloprofundus sp.]|nr:zinc-dependent metalloprotease family protein [Methyloprofundus sp.]